MTAAEAYEPGSPKRAGFREPTVCVFCLRVNSHRYSCPEAVGMRNVDGTFGLLRQALRADDDALEQAAKAHDAQERRQSDARLTVGQVDDHLSTLRKVAADITGGEFDTAKDAADTLLTAADDLEGELP